MRGDVKIMGTTSVIMFPIYAAGAILPDIVKWCDRWLSGLPGFFKADREEISPVALKLRHGLIYMVLIYTGEYIAGSFLWPKDSVPGTIPSGRIRSTESYVLLYPILVWDRPAF